jgi:hypothetical protein
MVDSFIWWEYERERGEREREREREKDGKTGCMITGRGYSGSRRERLGWI